MAVDNPILQWSDTVAYEPDRLPFSGTDGELTQAAGAVVDAIGRVRADTLKSNLDGATDEYLSQLKEQQNLLNAPMTDDVISAALGADPKDVAAADALVKPVLQQLAKLKLAEEQGAIDTTELQIRHEAILRDAIARSPGYAQEFIQAASETLGYNPIGAQLEAVTSELRSRGEGTGAPKNEVEAYYDKAADSLNIDRTLKYADPVGYYTKVQRELSLNEALQRNVRTLAGLSTTRQINEEDTRLYFRDSVVPALYAQIVKPLLAEAQGLRSLGAQELGASIALGAQRKFQAAAATAIRQMNEAIMSDPNLSFLTPEMRTQELAPVTAMLSEAASTVDPGKSLELVKQFLEAQTLNRVDLQHPEIGALRGLFSDYAKLPPGSLLSNAIGAQISDAAIITLMNAYGGVINHDTTGGVVIPPGVAVPSSKRPQVETSVARLLQDVTTLDNPSIWTIRAAVHKLGDYANEYTTSLNKGGKLKPKSSTVPWLDILISPQFVKNIKAAKLSKAEMGYALVPYSEVITAEAVDLGYDMRERMQDYADVRLSVGEDGLPIAKWDELLLGRAYKTHASHFVTLGWSDGRVTVSVRQDIKPEYTADAQSMVDAAARTQSFISPMATRLVTAAANLHAIITDSEPDYEAALRAPIGKGGMSLEEMILSIPFKDHE